MLVKERSRKANSIKVTFVLPLESDAETVHLVGEFNDWQTTHPLIRQPNNTWQVSLDLKSDHQYEFRYLVNGETWCNDLHADLYVPNGYGEENCVVVTSSH